MTLQGTIINGVVVLDDQAKLPEGTRVSVTTEASATAMATQQNEPTLGRLLKHAGSLSDMPADFSKQHDHYIHGTPRR